MHFIKIQYFSELHSVMKGFKENLSYLNFENNDHEIRIFLQKTQYLPNYDQFSLKILYKHFWILKLNIYMLYRIGSSGNSSVLQKT